MYAMLPFLLLICGAYLAYALGRLEKAYGKKHLAAGTALAFFAAALLVQLYLASDVWNNGTELYTIGGTTIGMSALSVFLSIVALGLGSVVCLYSVSYMAEDKGLEYYYPLLLLMVAGILGIGLATDLLVLYLAFELMAIPSYALVAFRRNEWRSIEAGMKYIVMSAVGSVLAFFGISLIYMQMGTLSFGALIGAVHASVLMQAALVFIIAGFGVKAAMAPLHTWLPDAHSAAPSGISAMLSGIVIAAGFITLLRTAMVFAGAGLGVGEVLIVMALLTMTVGNIMAYVQTAHQKPDLKRILAYSSVAQMGYIMLGIGVGMAYGIRTGYEGGFFHIMTHAFMKGLAFLCAGALIHQLGTRYVDEMRGAGLSMKFTGFALTLALLSLAGVPPLSGFMREWLVFSGSIQAYSTIGAWAILIAAIALINALLSLGYYLPIIKTLYMGPKDKKVIKARDPSTVMVVAMAILLALTIILGIWPELGLMAVKPVVDGMAALGGI